MKKLLLGLGALSLAVLPVMAVVSCGSTETTRELKITVSRSKVVTQTMIDDAITIINVSSQTEHNQWIALETIFDGITSDNFRTFHIKATPTLGSIAGTIVLTAKSGFDFGTSSTLTSMIVSNLPITSKFVTPQIIDKAILDMRKDPTKELIALQTIFDGITETNLPNFNYHTRGLGPDKIIFLTTKPGFVFGTSEYLFSIFNLPITNKASLSWDVINQAIIDINLATTNTDTTKALSTVFDGITMSNFKNFEIKTTPTAGSVLGKIILTAKDGFSFAGEETLTSKEGTPVIIHNI